MSFNASLFHLLFVLLLLTSCGSGGGGGQASNDSKVSSPPLPDQTSNWQLNGKVTFEQAHSNGYHIPEGIMEYDLESSRLVLISEGIYPRRHTSGEKTVFLQLCRDIPGEGEFFRVAIIDMSGVISHVIPCSADIPNPTTGVFLLDDYTEFGFVNMSQDQSMVSVTVTYDILSSEQNRVIGEAINTSVYDVFGNLINTFFDRQESYRLRIY